MKKSAALLSALLAVSILVSGCSFEPWKERRSDDAVRIQAELDAKDYLPLYTTLSDGEKEAYADFCAAVEARSADMITFGLYDTKEDAEAALDRWHEIYRMLPYDQPEYFWLDMYEYLYIITEEFGGRYKLKIQPEYLMDAESVETAKPVFNAKVDEIVREAEKQPSLYDKVLYVYDYILDVAEYDQPRVDAGDYDDAGINAYGCLVDGKTICSGYSAAFCLIMQRLGIECGVEFDSYDSDINRTDGHVWNYCKLDGEYYYFDLTWDDSSFENESYEPYVDHAYIYFGVDREELKASHKVTENPPIPYCGGKDYNYYIRGGMNLESYDFDAVSEIITAEQDESFIVIRFDDQEQIPLTESELLQSKLLFDILPDIESYSWIIPDTGHHLCILVNR